MRILLITQDEPFYLAENIAYLLRNMPGHSQVVGCCLLEASPFGKRESFLKKASKTWSIFGAGFFVHYTMRFLINRANPNRRVGNVLAKHGVPIIQLSRSINDPQSVDLLRSVQPDLLISIAGNQIFKQDVIGLAPKGCLNLHTAPLPKYRGLMPTFWVLKNREKRTAVSVFFVDEGIDSGPIIVQEAVDIGDRSQEELIRDTKRIGMDAIIKAINLIDRGDYALIENDATRKTYYPFPTRKDVLEFVEAGQRFY